MVRCGALPMSSVSLTVALQMQMRGLSVGIRSSSLARTSKAANAAGTASDASTTAASASATAAAASTTANSAALAAAKTAASYTDRVKLTGVNAVDSLLAAGRYWFHDAGGDGSKPSASAKHELTYSFLSSAAGLSSTDAAGFKSLTDAQKQRVRDALAYYSTVIDVSFTEVDSGGNIQYGANTQKSSAGYAYYANSLADGNSRVMLAANQSTFKSDWSAGSYEWEVLLHETGHALGLKHPGNYNAGGGGTPGPYLPAATDNRSETIMSYHDAANMKRVIAQGDGRFSTEHVNPDSLQGLDLKALQYLYGAAQTSDTATVTFQTDEIFSRTVWNPNAGSSIDLSNQTRNNVVDLRAGHKSSIAIRDPYADTGMKAADYAKRTALKSALGVPTYSGAGNLTIAAGSHFTAAVGGSGNDSFIANNEGDTISGGNGNDRIFWTGGDLTIDGGSGTDTLFVKAVAGKKWTLSDDKSSLTLVGKDAATGESKTLRTIALAGIEAVKLWNGVATSATGKTLYAIA